MLLQEQKRKRILKLTRGYYGTQERRTEAKNTWEKGLTYAFQASS